MNARLTLAGVVLAVASVTLPMHVHAQEASPSPDASAAPDAAASAVAEAASGAPASPSDAAASPEASPAASPSVDASPSPAADASPSPAADASIAAEASPAPDANAAADASPAADASAAAEAPEGSSGDATEASPSPAASPAPDPFLELERLLVPMKPPAARTAQQRDPFVPPAIIQAAVAPKVIVKTKEPKKRAASSIQRAKGFAISGVFFGERLRAVRIGGRRILEGDWFDESEGRVTISDAGAFQVMTVTPARIVFQNRAGDRLERDTQLRRQPKLEPLPPEPEPVESLAAPSSGETTAEASVDPGASPSPNP